MVLADSLKMISWGSAAGPAAFVVTKPLAMFLYRTPADPVSIAAVVAVFVLVGATAALEPARRLRPSIRRVAVRVD
jgi:hypothetical protein